MKGFFNSLTPKQQEAALAYEGPENFGFPDPASASAAMPSEEDVARVLDARSWRILDKARATDVKPFIEAMECCVAPSLDTARAVLALFAPILAEKERTAFRRETRALAQAQDWRNEAAKAEARALAAEAAVLAVSPYIDSIVCYASTIDTHDGNRVAKLVNEAAAAIIARDSAGPIANDNRKEVAA